MADTSFSTMEYDPVTGQMKQKKQQNLPYLNPNESSQGYLPYVGNQQPQATAQSLQQGNANVMGAAQNTALNQANPQNNAIRNQTQQMTQKLMTDPSAGMDWAKYNAGQLSQYDANAAKTVQKAKQELGDMGGSGNVQANLINMMMAQNTDRSALDNTLQMQQHDKSLEDQYKAVNQGITTADSFDQSQSNAIDNLLKVRSGYEGERSQDSANTQQMSVLDKTFGQDMAKLISSQDWQGVQNQLDREAAVASQNKNIDAQKAVQERQIAADLEKLKVTNDFTSIQNDIERQWKSSEATQDRTLQNSIIERQIALDKWKQENGQQFTAEQSALNRALELTLKDKDTEAQTNLMNLKASIDKGLLIDQQQFELVQNDLDRKLQEATNSGSWQNAIEITKLKGEIDAAAQKSAQEWQTTERKATQSWQTSERIGSEDAQKYLQILDQKGKEALQANDIAAQKDIENSRSMLQLKLQTQEMNQEVKMAYLNNELETARSNDDFNKQIKILAFTHAQELDKIQLKQGFEKSMAYINNNLEKALQNNDAANAQILQQKRYELESIEKAKDREIQNAQLALQQQGVDMQKLDAEYERLQSLVDAGSLDPSVLTQFVQKTLSTAGIKLTAPDPNAAQKEAQKKMDDLKNQFALSHPEYAFGGSNVSIDSNGNKYYVQADGTKKLDGTKAFNEFYNSAVYGELTSEEKDAKANAGKLGPEDLVYGDVGDVFKIDKATSFNGQKIPPGEYKVINADYSKGNKFFGTKDNFTKRVLVDSTGKWIATLKDVKTGAEGNIVSNLWAQ